MLIVIENFKKKKKKKKKYKYSTDHYSIMSRHLTNKSIITALSEACMLPSTYSLENTSTIEIDMT
jgi:hypothetical protein